MSNITSPAGESTRAILALRNFASRPAAPVERCGMCNEGVPAEHRHVVEPGSRRIACACGACAVLFAGNGRGKFRVIPNTVRHLKDFALTDIEWNALRIPIEMAFFFRSSVDNKVTALYPSPAGATESVLELEEWGNLVAKNPSIADLESDVEALLVNRIGSKNEARQEVFRAPIDDCFRLVGVIRSSWRGLSGGAEVWTKINLFFSGLRKRSELAERV